MLHFFQNIHVTVSTYLLTAKLLPLASYQTSHTAKKSNSRFNLTVSSPDLQVRQSQKSRSALTAIQASHTGRAYPQLLPSLYSRVLSWMLGRGGNPQGCTQMQRKPQTQRVCYTTWWISALKPTCCTMLWKMGWGGRGGREGEGKATDSVTCIMWMQLSYGFYCPCTTRCVILK